MKAPWWLKAAALALLCCCCGGCAHSSEKQAEAHEAVNATETAKASGSFAETKVEGPETITTTVEEWADVEAPPIREAPPLSAQSEAGEATPTRGGGETYLPPRAALIKRTITVDQRGPVSTTIAARATEATREAVQATREVKTDQRSKWSALVPWWLWLVGLVALGGGAWLLRSRIRMLVGL